MPLESFPSLDKKFVEETLSLQTFLCGLKQEFDRYDIDLKEEKSKILILNERRTDVFKKLDFYFDSLWDIVKDYSKSRVQLHKHFFESKLFDYLAAGIESNTYIREQPLGYAGDYMMMNMIYDYHQGKYFGKTLYSKLINHYTCNIDVACSNIYRKEYLKEKLLKYSAEGKTFQVLSVGCGPAREWLELLREKKLNGPVRVHLLDLEKNAIEFVKKELDKIDFDRKKVIIDFHMLDLIEIVRSKRIKELFADVDFIYVSGVFDYLSDRIATKVLKGLFEVSKKELVVFNMSYENGRHRIYYEMFGHWVMWHRKKEDVLKWCEPFSGRAKVDVGEYPGCKSYWVLDLRKV